MHEEQVEMAENTRKCYKLLITDFMQQSRIGAKQ